MLNSHNLIVYIVLLSKTLNEGCNINTELFSIKLWSNLGEEKTLKAKTLTTKHLTLNTEH